MCIQFPCPIENPTAAEQKILEFIESHREEFLFMTIGQLSEQLGVSQATISRFARHTGCGDFKALKSLVISQNHGEGPAAKLAGTLLQEEGFSLSGYLFRQQQYLEKTAEHLTEEEFRKAAAKIMEADRIFVHGKSASSFVAGLLFFRLRRLGLDVSLLPSGGSEIAEGLARAKKGDLVILFSFSKLSREGRVILDCAKETGYDTLAFTGRLHAPLEEQADINLYVYRGPQKEYHSMTAATAVVDALVVAVSEQLGGEGVRCLKRIHEIKKKYSNFT